MSMKKCKECGEEISSTAKNCPKCGADSRNWFMEHKIITFLGCFLLLTILIVGTNNKTTKNVNTTTSESNNLKQTEKSIQKTWQKVIEFSGNSMKNTETFKINSNDWRINWSTEPSNLGDMNFQIFVYDSKGNLNGVAANIIGKGNDISYMKKLGEYYLTINTAQNYRIIIEENK